LTLTHLICRSVVVAMFGMLLAGCSTIVDGTSQQIVVDTNPADADCGLYREGVRIGEVAHTPGSVLIKKTKHDISVVCVKDGYQQASYFNKSGVAGATFGNIILGGGVGWIIDSATGSDNKYDSPVNLTLPATPAGVAQTPAVLPASVTLAPPAVAAKPTT
jgi:hypothetical protein